MTTDKGFSILDYQHKEFRNYDELPLNCISENALYKSRKGEIFIGGTTGMISFQEKDLEQAPRSYRILPYRLTVNGENIQTGDQSGILHRNITYTPKITLKSFPRKRTTVCGYSPADWQPFLCRSANARDRPARRWDLRSEARDSRGRIG